MSLGYTDIYPGMGTAVDGASTDVQTVQAAPVGKAPAISWLAVLAVFIIYRVFYDSLPGG